MHRSLCLLDEFDQISVTGNIFDSDILTVVARPALSAYFQGQDMPQFQAPDPGAICTKFN